MKPQRIQRQRTKGWKMPPDTVYVGRPTKWGNPTRWQDCPPDIGSPEWARDAAVEDYEEQLRNGQLLVLMEDVKRELRGKNLACWCPLDQPCHVDVLLRIANER